MKFRFSLLTLKIIIINKIHKVKILVPRMITSALQRSTSITKKRRFLCYYIILQLHVFYCINDLQIHCSRQILFVPQNF